MTKSGRRVGLLIGGVLLGLIVLITAFVSGLSFLGKGGKSTTSLSPPTATVVLPTAQPLFSENFSNNDKKWDTGNGNGYSRTISGNMLIMAEDNRKLLPESVPTTSNYSDVMVTVTGTLLQADKNDSLGIYIRGDSNLDHDYRVDISGDNTFSISKEYVDARNIARIKFPAGGEATHTSLLAPLGKENTISVIAKGTTLAVLINNKKAGQVSDPDYSVGQVALFVENGATSSGVKASFRSLALYPAPSQIPS